MRSLPSQEEVVACWQIDTSAHCLVSVLCITYNQASYIEDALKGILLQKTNFPFEVIIHDDASTDGTKEIISEYIKCYPDIFIPVLREENVYSQGVSPIVESLKAANGRYVAICEGDDYWLGCDKLQTQFDFMEKNKQYSFTCHNADVNYVGSGETRVFNERLKSGSYSVLDLIFRSWFVPTASVFFKREIVIDSFPEWFGSVRSQDLTLEIMLALNGRFWYSDQILSVYRKNAIGSLSLSKEKPWNYLKLRMKLFVKLSAIFPIWLKPFAFVDIFLSLLKIFYAILKTER